MQAFCHAEKLFRLIDLDGDGNLTQTEFLKVIKTHCTSKEDNTSWEEQWPEKEKREMRIDQC